MHDYVRKILTARVYDVAVESPLDPMVRLSQRLGTPVLLKREDLQPVFCGLGCRGRARLANKTEQVHDARLNNRWNRPGRRSPWMRISTWVPVSRDTASS